MRTIKFRAIDKYGQWAYFGVFSAYADLVDAKTLGQWTGLSDKNGKEIYEGDLIRAVETDEVFRIDEITPMHRHSHATNVGYFSDGKYHSRTASAAYDIHDDWMSWLEMYEVIGNIYENPELLPNQD